MNPRLTARSTGILLLLTAAMGIFAEGFVSQRLISFSDAALTANNILKHRSLFQFSFTVYLIEMTCQIGSAALFYVLLQPVSRSIALVAAVLELSGCAIKTMSRLFYVAPLFFLSGSPAFGAFNTDQLRVLSLILLRINSQGAGVALAFFGTSVLLHGYLILRSTFLPRFLGILGMIAGVGWLTFFYPPLGYRSFIYIAPFALVVLVIEIFWLIVFGVDEEKWKEQRMLQA